MTCKKLLNDGSIWFNASLIFFPIPFNLCHPPPFHVPPRERIFGVRPASCTAALLLCRRMAAVMACFKRSGPAKTARMSFDLDDATSNTG